MDFMRSGKPNMKEMRTVRVMMRRLMPGLVFRMVLESNCEVDSVMLVPESRSASFGSDGGESEISAIAAVVDEGSVDSSVRI
jgi:hypothetical protein